MKIIDVDALESFIVTTDEEDQFQYARHGPDCWTVVMGQSEETVFDCKEIEALFQEYVKKHNLEQIPCDASYAVEALEDFIGWVFDEGGRALKYDKKDLIRMVGALQTKRSNDMNKVYLTTPAGEVAIVKSKIVAVSSVDIRVAGSDKIVRSQIFTDGSDDPFNILETFEYATGRI